MANVIVERKCMKCGETVAVACPEAGFAMWQAGALIQYAMPDLSANEREILISGVCGPCFDKMFPDDGGAESGVEDDDTDSDG